MSSVTTNYSFPKPGLDSSTNTWGTELNQAFDMIDSALYDRESEIKSVVNRNYIINPCFIINQVYGGSSVTNLTDNKYFSDRWASKKFNTATVTYDLQNGILNATGYNNKTNYCGRFLVSAKNDTVQASNYYYIKNTLEGYDWESLRGNTYLMLSFWVKSNKTGTYCVALQNTAQNRSYVREYSITGTDWEYKSLTITTDTNTSWNLTNVPAAQFVWTFQAGTTYQGTANQWHAANYIATSNQVNFLNTTTNNFYLTQVKVNAGNIDYPYQQRFIQEEIKLCERYHEKSWDLNTESRVATVSGQYLWNVHGGNAGSEFSLGSSMIWFNIPYKTRKARVALDGIAVYAPSTAVVNNFSMYNAGGSANIAAGYTCSGETGFVVVNSTSVVAGTAVEYYSLQFYADTNLI